MIENQSTNYSNTYKYTGKQKDNQTNLYYYGARYYTSDLSRFTSIDPLLLDQASTKKLVEVLNDPQQLNSYTYARNNPVIYTDPAGEYAMAIPAIAKMAEAAMIAIMGSILINDAVDNIKSTPSLPQEGPNITKTPALPESKGDITTTPANTDPGLGIVSTPSLPQGQGNIISTPAYNGPTAGSCGVNMSCANSDNRSLPIYGIPNASELLWKDGSIEQARERDSFGNPVKDIDFTDHGNPALHTNPHEHYWTPKNDGSYDHTSRGSGVNIK